MKRRTRVYVSGPLTKGMLTSNVHRALDAASELLRRGYAVYVPHTNVLWEIAHPPIDNPLEAEAVWLAHDFEWVAACDVLLRLPGASPGADKEVELAHKLGIPVYYALEILLGNEPNIMEAA